MSIGDGLPWGAPAPKTMPTAVAGTVAVLMRWRPEVTYIQPSGSTRA
jgi:hypothetical protein